MIKRTAVIQDLSGMGKCSLTAAIPVMAVLKVQALPLPSAILSNQTGYDSYYIDDYTDKMRHFTEEWAKNGAKIDSILTGYLSSKEQVDEIFHFIEVFRKEGQMLFVDPVMGDSGQPYKTYSPDFLNRMKALAASADVILPNLTELCMLTDTDYALLTADKGDDYPDRIAAIANSLLSDATKTVIVTGIIHKSASDIEEKYYNLVCEKDHVSFVTTGIHGGSYSGTGDLLSAVVCGSMTNGESALSALSKAAHFLEAALIATVEDGTPCVDGIQFEPFLPMLL